MKARDGGDVLHFALDELVYGYRLNWKVGFMTHAMLYYEDGPYQASCF